MGFKTIRRVNATADTVLGSVVRAWVENMERLTSDWRDISDDIPWLYTERPLLSVLAGGVWNLGGSAFEEYSSEKRREADPKWRAGREDIHFSLRRRYFKGEAKFVWAPATRVGVKAASHLARKLQLAVNDAKSCRPDGQERLGILFATPYISKKHQKALGPFIENWMDEVFEKVPSTASAAVFPASVRSNCWWKNHAYPGAAVFVRRL